ncbi:hypothetical protein KUL152_25430 [Tenacibaculum sp. KUL152]|nr:hypothetical protein KUL152_25430 [Tenacibaculum sp. KUL152]
MKIGVYRPTELPESFNVCIDNIVKHAERIGVEFIQTTDPSVLSGCDIIWDPRAGGGHATVASLYDLGKPIVVTLHGIGPLIYPSHYSVGLRHRFQLFRENIRKKKAWKQARGKYSKVVTVSEFSKKVINKYLGIDLEDIRVVYNGVDASIFTNSINENQGSPYFLHVSNDESRKNVDRIIEAYSLIEDPDKWPLVLKLSSNRECNVKKVEVIKERLSEKQLSGLYQGAGAFLFPSIYEGFGIPIIESMASHCPVITSADTACEEVSGTHGILVDPMSATSIKEAMLNIMHTPYSNEQLIAAERHAKSFSWEKAAEQYLDIFTEVVKK